MIWHYNKKEMQVMVWDVENNADRERYCIHPTKSHILWYKRRRNSDFDMIAICLDKR